MNEMERLQAENQRLRDALHSILDVSRDDGLARMVEVMREHAFRALNDASQR